jgi:hypothetical protein
LESTGDFGRFQFARKGSGGFKKKKKLFCMTSSQIWLSPLVNDCQVHLPHKIERGKKNPYKKFPSFKKKENGKQFSKEFFHLERVCSHVVCRLAAAVVTVL